MAIEVKSLSFDEAPLFARKMVYYYGLLAINWAKLENQLDMLLLTVNLPEFSKKNYQDHPSVSVRIKCDIFKKWFVQDPRFKEMHSRAKRLHKSLKAASKDRNLLLHSSVQEFLRGDPHAVRIIALEVDSKKRKFTVTRGNITQDKIERAAKSMARLSKGMEQLCNIVMNDEFRAGLFEKP